RRGRGRRTGPRPKTRPRAPLSAPWARPVSSGGPGVHVRSSCCSPSTLPRSSARRTMRGDVPYDRGDTTMREAYQSDLRHIVDDLLDMADMVEIGRAHVCTPVT